MFVLGRLLWLAARPGRVAFILLCLGVLLLFTRRWRRGRMLLVGMLAASIFFGTVPVGGWLSRQLESRFPRVALPAHIDGIILLGGDMDPAKTIAAGYPVGRIGRLLAFVDLAQRYPDARLVFTGGTSDLIGGVPEASAMPVALRAVGFDPGRVDFEGRSRNTHENAVFTYDLVKPKPGETWVLITSAVHMPRAVATFRKTGFSVVPYPVDFQVKTSGYQLRFDDGFEDLVGPAKEIIGLVAYRILGYSDALFPEP